MIALKLLLIAMLLGLCLPLGYLSAVTAAAFRFRKKTALNGQPLRMGVLIPAHNEAVVIRRTIASVLNSSYPIDRLTVMVIADNCTDSTADDVRRAGVPAFERFDPDHAGKGQALDWFLTNFQDLYGHLDAITIIDADVEVDPDCLREISDSLNYPGAQVVQGFNGVSNPGAGWRPALCDAAFNVFNHLRVAGTEHLSGTAVLKGLGMGFRTDVLMRRGWPAHSVVEDQELTLRLLFDGIHVHYNPDAVVRSEMVTSGDRAAGQRSRWEGGRYSLMRMMAPVLIRLWAKTFDSRYMYALCELVIPPLSLLVSGAVLTAVSTALLLPEWIWIAGVQCMILVVYVASGQIQRRAPFLTWLYLAAAPLFVLWKIPLYLKLLFGRGSLRWIRTVREAEPDEMGLE